jgi:hypothetical protein
MPARLDCMQETPGLQTVGKNHLIDKAQVNSQYVGADEDESGQFCAYEKMR